jgi:hypothetical protein
MKRKILLGSILFVIAALISIGTTTSAAGQANSGKACDERLITVLNPAISAKIVERVPLTPRLETIYLYDTQWGGPDAAYSVYQEMQDWFSRNMPSVKTVIHRGPGWMAQDKQIVKEITANRVDGIILGIAG